MAPAIVAAGLAGVVFKVLAAGTIGAGVKALADKLTGGGVNSYLSQYHNLKYNFEKTARSAAPLAALGTRVEEVFGRPLA
jgi:uncharacterized membrane protein YjjP (DUF1212 family)